MSSSIGPHGRACHYCLGGDAEWWRSDPHEKPCSYCHGTGCACVGGEVREAAYIRRLDHGGCELDLAATFYICQTCGCIVPAEDVQHG